MFKPLTFSSARPVATAAASPARLAVSHVISRGEQLAATWKRAAPSDGEAANEFMQLRFRLGQIEFGGLSADELVRVANDTTKLSAVSKSLGLLRQNNGASSAAEAGHLTLAIQDLRRDLLDTHATVRLRQGLEARPRPLEALRALARSSPVPAPLLGVAPDASLLKTQPEWAREAAWARVEVTNPTEARALVGHWLRSGAEYDPLRRAVDAPRRYDALWQEAFDSALVDVHGRWRAAVIKSFSQP